MSRAIFVLPRPRLDLRGLLTRNVILKLAAFAVAVLVWLALSQAQAPEEQTAPFGGDIPVQRLNMPSGYVLRGTLGNVNVSVHGPVNDVRGLAVSSFRAEVDLAQYDLARVGDVEDLPVRVSVVPDSLRIVEIRPTVVAAKLVPVEAKQMTIQVRYDNQPPVGYQAAEPTISPGTVEVRGPADALREAVSVVVQVRFTDAPNDLRLTPRAVPVDAAGREVPDVEVQPRNVSVAVAVEQATPTRTVGVIPVIVGQPASGFWVAEATSTPAVIAVRGDPATLEAVDHIATAAIEIGGATSDRLVRVPLVLPSGTSLAQGDGIVQVAISVRPLSGTRLFSTAVQVQGLGSGLAAELDPKAVDVLVSGALATVQGTRPEQVVATVDVTGRSPGTYLLDASLRGPSGVTVAAASTARITVVVRSR